jgi:hypothetical protein
MINTDKCFKQHLGAAGGKMGTTQENRQIDTAAAEEEP